LEFFKQIENVSVVISRVVLKVIELAEKCVKSLKPTVDEVREKRINTDLSENSLETASTNSFELPEELTVSRMSSENTNKSEETNMNVKNVSDLKRCQFRNFRHFGKSVINFHLSKNYNKKSSFSKIHSSNKSKKPRKKIEFSINSSVSNNNSGTDIKYLK
jgi:hypothetical protein